MNERLRKTGATLSATIALGGLGVGATKLAEGQPAMAAEQQVAHANAHEQGESARLYKWNSVLKRWTINPSYPNGKQALEKDQKTVNFKYGLDALVVIHKPRKGTPYALGLMSGPSFYGNKYEGFYGVGGESFPTTGPGFFTSKPNVGNDSSIVCFAPYVGWGTKNHNRYLGLWFPTDSSVSSEQMAYFDMDLALQSGAIDFYAGKGYGQGSLAFRHTSGKTIPINKFENMGLGMCATYADFPSNASEKAINSFVKRTFNMHKINVPNIPH